ncbi:MAG: hypothetical protein WCJ39_08960 [bacterium]
MIYKHDYVKDIIGAEPREKIAPIQKLEPEIIPEENVFGIVDIAETKELISVLKDNCIDRINICFPLNERDEKFIKLTFTAIQNILEGGICVSMSNIDSIDKVKFAQEACQNISYFTKATPVPPVEQYCRDKNIPFLPGASNRAEFVQRGAEGYRVVKAYPFVKDQLIDIITTSKDASLLYNPAGGIIPVLRDKQGDPKEISDFFLKCVALENVINISATDPAKCLIKSSTT